jgi:hypothetical protein
LLDSAILNRIEPAGAIDRAKDIQTRSLKWLMNNDRLLRMVENESFNGDEAYTVLKMLEDLREGVFAELYSGEAADAYRRNLQRAYVDIALSKVAMLEDEDNNHEEITISDIILLMRFELETLSNDRRSQTNDKMSRIHWDDLLARIVQVYE